nr:MAG TPA: hypothetical protein [Caudoviricetes sp.]
MTLRRSVNAKRYFRTVNFTHFALLLRVTYYRLFHGLLTFAFARGFLSPSKRTFRAVSVTFAAPPWL